MPTGPSDAAGLSVLLITGDASLAGRLEQGLTEHHCVVTLIELQKVQQQIPTQNWYDLIVFEMNQLSSAVLHFWAALKNDSRLYHTPVIVVATRKDIATFQNRLPLRPLVYFIQRDAITEKRVIEQAKYVSYLQNRYN